MMKDLNTMNTPLRTLITALSIVVLAPLGAVADDAHHKPAAAAGTADMTDGEVRKVDLDAGKVTLRHGEIKSLDMPAMTCPACGHRIVIPITGNHGPANLVLIAPNVWDTSIPMPKVQVPTRYRTPMPRKSMLAQTA